jgi:hypothetical protein
MTATKPILAVWLIFTQKEALISLVDAPNIVIDNRKTTIKDYLPNVSAMSEAPACTIFGASTKLINASFCVNISHTARIGFVAVIAALCYILISVAYSNTTIPWMFNVALSASIFSGIS